MVTTHQTQTWFHVNTLPPFREQADACDRVDKQTRMKSDPTHKRFAADGVDFAPFPDRAPFAGAARTRKRPSGVGDDRFVLGCHN